MQDALEVVGEREEGAEERRTHQQGGQERPAPVAVQDDPQGEERVGGPLLDDDEGHQQDGGHGEQDDGGRGAPAVGAGFGEAVDEGQ